MKKTLLIVNVLEIFLLIFMAYKIQYLGGDFTFPYNASNFHAVDDTFLYMWNNGIMGTTTIIEKLRSVYIFIFSTFGVLYYKFYYFILFCVGYYSLLNLFDYIFGSKNSTLYFRLIALIYVVNPFVIRHFGHYLLLQGYYITPLIIYCFIILITSSRHITSYVVFFLLGIMGLGQPHNWANVGLLIILLSLYKLLLVYRKGGIGNIILIMKRYVLISFLTLLSLSYVILPFFSGPNELTSSLRSISGQETNLLYSSKQGLINTLLFNQEILDKLNLTILVSIYVLLNGFLLVLVLYTLSGKKYGKIGSIALICTAGLSFISLIFPEFLRDYVYFFLPHLRTDTSYIMPMFILFFLTGVSFVVNFYQKGIVRYVLNGSLIVICLLNIFVYIDFFQKKGDIIDEKMSMQFSNFIQNHFTGKQRYGLIILPYSVGYYFPGHKIEAYPSVMLNNINNYSTINWPAQELGMLPSLKFLNQFLGKDQDVSYSQKTSMTHVMCFDGYGKLNCNEIFQKNEIQNIGIFSAGNSTLYPVFLGKIKHPTPLVFMAGDRLLKLYTTNPTQYYISTTLKSKQELKFLQSYHPEWKIYLEPYTSLNCGSGAMAYSGVVSGESEKGAKTLLTSPSQGEDGATSMTSTGIYLTQRGDTLASIARVHTGMTLTGIISLNPGVTQKTLRQRTEIVVSQIRNPHNLLSQGGTGAVEQSGKSDTYHFTECPSKNQFYAGGELSKLWQKPIFDDTHKMVYDYANQWTIDPAYIKANYPKEYYKENPDGTIDVRMTLYFKPQSYFYLGLIISGLTLLGFVGYLVVSGVRGRRKKVDTSGEEL